MTLSVLKYKVHKVSWKVPQIVTELYVKQVKCTPFISCQSVKYDTIKENITNFLYKNEVCAEYCC